LLTITHKACDGANAEFVDCTGEHVNNLMISGESRIIRHQKFGPILTNFVVCVIKAEKAYCPQYSSILDINRTTDVCQVSIHA